LFGGLIIVWAGLHGGGYGFILAINLLLLMLLVEMAVLASKKQEATEAGGVTA